jgi:hypothetical protein
MNEIVAFLSRVNTQRKELNALNSINKVHRNKVHRDAKCHESFNSLHKGYQNSLKEIKIGKLNDTNFNNIEEIEKAFKEKLLTDQQIVNLIYNNKIAKVRDKHPIIYIIKNNKVYFMVQTNQNVIVPKPLQDELDEIQFLNYIPVVEIFKGKYVANVIYVIEAKNVTDLLNIVEDVEQNVLLKTKFVSNQEETKEQAFKFFYKFILNQEPEIFNDEEKFPVVVDLIAGPFTKTNLVDITFGKYITDNIHRMTMYEQYRLESFSEYLRITNTENIVNSDDI